MPIQLALAATELAVGCKGRPKAVPQSVRPRTRSLRSSYRTGSTGSVLQKTSPVLLRRMPIMLNANSSRCKWSMIVLTLATVGALSAPVLGQEAPAVHVGNTQITGLPD